MPLLVDKSLYNTLDFLPEGYFIVDNDYKVIYWNKSLEILTGVDKENILNTKLEDTFPNFGNDIYKRRIDPIFKGGPPVVFSAKLHKNLFSQGKNQNEFYYQVTISSLRVTEENHNALFSIENRNEVYNQINQLINLRDKALNEVSEKEEVHSRLISQHIEIQEAFSSLSEKNLQIEKQKQQLLELNATKDKFFSILAHDLINPFSFLMGYSALLYDKFDTYTPMELKEMIGLMNQTSKQTYDLLQNLLQWSRAHSRRLENKPLKIKLAEIVINNFELLKNNLLDKNIEISHYILNDLYVFVDYNMINTVLRNLISNAIKFTPQGGKIIISLNETGKNSNPDEKFVIVTVSDTGVGISPENINKLFKIEGNITTPGTNNERGTGLGLILCKEFIEIMGGEIWVESEVKKGSTFFIKIPLCTDQ